MQLKLLEAANRLQREAVVKEREKSDRDNQFKTESTYRGLGDAIVKICRSRYGIYRLHVESIFVFVMHVLACT